MHRASCLAAGFVLVLGAVLAACGGPPKQAEVPDVENGSGVDMGAEEPSAAPVASSQASAKTEDEEKMHAKCCDACKAGLAKDRTGAAPNTIPCSDFTADLSPWCLEHFRSRPTMASECK